MTADVMHAPAGFRELASLAFDRANSASDTAGDTAARLTTHEATDALTHSALDARVGVLEREFRRATYWLIGGMGSILVAIVAKGHLF